MKKLAKKFTSKGFTYTEITRNGDKAIYRQEKDDMQPSYEVVVIGKHTGYELNGVKILPAETYPSSTTWGIRGWTFTDLDLAKKKFKKIS